MFKKTFSTLILMFISLSYSQNEVDALRYSLFDNYNTAGISSLGGSGGLLSPNYNPASLGFFSGDQLFSISLINNAQSIEASYLNETNTLKKPFNLAPSIQNIGYAKSYNLGPNTEDGWNKINVSISYNQKRDFNKEIILSGHNNSSSMSNVYLQSAEDLTPDELDPFDDYLAWYTWLIDPINNIVGSDTIFTGEYSSHATSGNYQRMEIDETGSIREYDFACSGSYKDFLFLGGSIGLTEIQFTQRNSYQENDFLSTESNQLDNFEYNQYLHSEGDGINFKIGTFIKPISFLRIGWAYHSKTYTNLEEIYETSMETNFINGDSYESFSPINVFNYELNTPAKSITSLALIKSFNNLKCLLTFDYEAIDYGSSNLYSTYYNFSQENDNISDFYDRTNNKKVGLSLTLNNISLRGGYAIFGSPFQNNLNDGEREYLSAGIGVKSGDYSFDIAMTQWVQQEDYILYRDMSADNPNQTANINSQGNTIIITCNYKF